MKRAVVMTDISGLGNCSANANIAVMSVLGVETCLVPTAILSAQTGFGDVYFKGLYRESADIAESLISHEPQVNAVYIGFLTCAEQYRTALRLIDAFSPKAAVLADPICGDGGERFSFVDDEMFMNLRRVVGRADIITPNITELCLLGGGDYKKLSSLGGNAQISYAESLCRNIMNGRKMTVVVTGLGDDDTAVNITVTDSGCDVSRSERCGGSMSGTGDIFSSVICAQAAKGESISAACDTAARFISYVMSREAGNITDRNYGIPYQKYLSMLING